MPCLRFRQPGSMHVTASICRFARLRGPPHQLTLSRNSLGDLMWSAKYGTPKSLLICLLPLFQGVPVATRIYVLRHLQLPDMGANIRPPDGASVVHRRKNDLLIQQRSVSDGKVTPCLGEDIIHPVFGQLFF
jgi:hypothetical protein